MHAARNVQASRPAEKLETWSEHAYNRLRRDVLSGNLRPGTKLKIEQLREQYGVGPTPLREALSRLASEGLVQIEQLKGFRVAPVSGKELEELCELRVIIESEAIRRSIQFGDESWEAQIAAAYYRLERLQQRLAQGEEVDPDEREARHRDFHDAIVAAADSEWLLRLRSQLFDHHERYRRFARIILSAAPSRDISAEHRNMMDAVLARNAEEAARLMTGHILATRELLRHRFQT